MLDGPRREKANSPVLLQREEKAKWLHSREIQRGLWVSFRPGHVTPAVVLKATTVGRTSRGWHRNAVCPCLGKSPHTDTVYSVICLCNPPIPTHITLFSVAASVVQWVVTQCKATVSSGLNLSLFTFKLLMISVVDTLGGGITSLHPFYSFLWTQYVQDLPFLGLLLLKCFSSEKDRLHLKNVS